MSEQGIGDGKINREALKAALGRGIKNLENTPVSGVSMPPIEKLTTDTDTATSSDSRDLEWFEHSTPSSS
ncbi:MAG TPA: hypothetical protein VN174_04235 [Candidatus Methanoperedens sp.]|nr:hypothetical protein [Candidatus Methanoperedens sp.]